MLGSKLAAILLSDTAQTRANPHTPCRFFNTYTINKKNQPQGQYCAMYTQQWDNSYATVSQVAYNGTTHQTSYSYSYTCAKNNFGCSHVGSCYTYSQCSNNKNSDCLCGSDTAGNALCHQPDSCSSPSCSKSSDCQSGYACLNANNCCGISVCVRASICANKNSKRYIFRKRQKVDERTTDYVPPAAAGEA